MEWGEQRLPHRHIRSSLGSEAADGATEIAEATGVRNPVRDMIYSPPDSVVTE
jgi:hypothetical protein